MYLKWWTAHLNRTNTLQTKLSFVFRSTMIALSFVIVSGCSLLPKEADDEAMPTINPPKISKKPEYDVKKDTLESTVRGSGKLMATKEEELFFTLDGKRVKDVYVKAGDTVKAGQLIAELDVADIERQLRQMQLDIRQAELQMKTTLRSGDKTPEDLEKAKIYFEKKRLDLAEKQEMVDKAKLTAPFDGSVAAVYVQKGDSVKAYDSIAVVADLSQLTVAVNVSPDDLKKVAVGMETVVDINGTGQVKGKVAQLPNPKADNSGNANGGGGFPGNGQGNNGQAKQKDAIANYLLITLDKMPDTAKRGTALSASIVYQRKENVVVIPPAALRTVSGRNYVQVVGDKGTKREVDVEVGQQTSTSVEIKKGLTAGQKVVGR